MTNRRGMTLIEVLVALMVGSIIAGIGVMLIGSLLRTEHVGRRHLSETRALDRLAKQFTADVHAASLADLRPEIADSKSPVPLLTLTTGIGEQIEYRQQDRALVRRESRDGAVVRQEAFRLPAAHILRATAEPTDTPKWVTLVIDRVDTLPASGFSTARHGWNVVAELGRQNRLAKAISMDPGKEAP